MMDTIFALSTGDVRSGIAIIRVSGPSSPRICEALTGRILPERRAVLCSIVDPISGELLDEGLVLRFGHGRSYTGEASLEFQIHGGRATTRAVLKAVGDTGLARMALPGEFTRRALENGSLDLSQVEALGDLIEAETETQRRQALQVLDGALGREVERWREALVWMVSQVAVSIDFADEEVPENVLSTFVNRADQLIRAFERELSGAEKAQIVREGYQVAIVGPPNVGKSTLLNNLAGRDVAITSDLPGTTRDVVEVVLQIGGQSVVFLDTAGIRDSDDQLENEGILRARKRSKAANMRVFLVGSENNVSDLNIELGQNDVVLGSKSDLHSYGELPAISGYTGEGIDNLLEIISNRASTAIGDGALVIRERQRLAILEAKSHLEAAVSWIKGDEGDIDFVSEELRLSIEALDSLVGRIGVEEVLGEIFSRFCLGK